MEIILKETIDTLGQEGDIVKVKPGYGRNYLIPQKKAVLANESTLAILQQDKKIIQARLEKQKKESQSLADRLLGVTIEITKRVGDEDRLFGSVTSADIAEKLKEAGIIVEKRMILLNEPIKTTGEKKVLIKVGYQMTAEIIVQVIPEISSDEE